MWEKIARKFRTHEMPPPGAPRPDGATYAAVTAHLENALDAAAAAIPNPGRVPVHRLNRTEYANAIRDLLGLDIDSRGVLPADDADQEGFDNVASVLTVSPALLENYLSAARMISRLAVGDTSRKPMVDVFKVERDMVQDERMSEELPFGSRGGTAVTYQFPVDGEYLFKIELKRQLYDYIVGMGEPHQLDVRLDGVAAEALHGRRRRQGDDDPGELRRQYARRSRVGKIHAHGGSRPRSARAGESGTARRRRVVRADGCGKAKACCSRRRRVSAAPRTSCTSDIPR